MTEMIERVARASFACWRKRMDELGEYLDHRRDFEGMSESEREFAYLHARAVIEAMRDPTAAMWNAPALADVFVSGIYPSGEESEKIWRAMIDATLDKPAE